MNKVFKYRLKPTKNQEQTFLQYLGATRFLYNSALEHRIIAYQSAKKSISYYDQQYELPLIKKTEGFEWLKDIYAQVLQDTLKRLDQSFKNFFKSKFGFPSFAKKGKWNCFRFPQIINLKIKGNKIKIPKIGFVKLIQHRPLKGNPKTISIVKENNHWYICICVKVEPKKFNSENQAVGIDVGVIRLATLSDGTYFENPQYFKQYRRELRIKQRKLARQKKFGKNWYKTVNQISNLHLVIKRSRLDYLHKVSFVITSNYNIIFAEDLKIKNLVKRTKGEGVARKSGLNRSILDSSLGKLLSQLNYKTEFQNGFFQPVNPAYTSQKCSNCGCVDSQNRKSQANFKCIKCSFALNADVNAAKNIYSSGMELLPLTWSVDSCVGKEIYQKSR